MSLGCLEPAVIVYKPRLNGTPVQLPHSPHHTAHCELEGKSHLVRIIYHHSIKDCLHHLRNMGVIDISHGSPEIKVGAEAMVVQGEWPGARSRGLP